jgi:hypothetical protein
MAEQLDETVSSADSTGSFSGFEYDETLKHLTRMFSEICPEAEFWYSHAASPLNDDMSDQFKLCEEMNEECIKISMSILKTLDEAPPGAANLLRELLLTAGMSVSYFSKLQLSEPEGRTARLLHLYTGSLTSLKISKYARSSFKVKVLDMDSELDPIFPSCSDISLLVEAENCRPCTILIDYTYGRATEEKKANLTAAISSLASQHGVTAMSVILQFKHTEADKFSRLAYDEPIETSSDCNFSMSEKAIDNLGMRIQRSSDQEIRGFVTTLSEALDPILDEYSNAAMLIPNDQEKLFKELASLHSYLDSVRPTLEVNLRDAIDTARIDSADMLIEAIVIAKKRQLFVAASFLERPFTTCSITKYREAIRTAIPLLCPEKTIRDALFEQGCKTDPFFYIMDLALKDTSEDSYKKGIWVLEGKKVVPCPDFWIANFDKPQDLRVTFPKGVIGAYRRPIYNKHTKEKNEFGAEISVKTLVFEPGACILVNPLYTDDTAFLKFLRRRTPDVKEPHKDKPKVDQTLKENQSAALRAHFQMLASLCPSDDESELRARASFSFADRVDLLILNHSAENLKYTFHECRKIIDNPLLDSLDERYQSAKGISSAMSAFRKPNYATLISSSQYCSWTFMYVNSPITNFKTTWLRRLTLSTDLYSAYSELSSNRVNLSYPMNSQKPAGLSGYNPKEIFSNFAGDHTLWVSSKFHSIDKNQLEWDLMAAPRALVKCASLFEHRRAVYSEPGTYNPMNPQSQTRGRAFGRMEALTQCATFLHNSQQMSVIYEGTRFLHQALSSLDCDFSGVLKKITGARVKTQTELANFLQMSIPYVLAVMFRASEGLNSLKSKSKEVRVLLGGLIKATSDPTFNVGLYSISSQLNDIKFNRVPAEADCVNSIWKSNSQLEKTIKEKSEHYNGLPKGLAYEWGVMGLDIESYTLADYGKAVIDDLEAVRAFHMDFIKFERDATYVSSSLIEIYSNLKVRLEIGTLSSINKMVGKDIASQFTTRGSHVNSDFIPGVRTKSIRKASALLAMTGAALTRDEDHYDESCVMKVKALQDRISEVLSARDSISPQIDYYALFLCMATGVLNSYPTIQLSQKDARGKNREISTLNVTYGMRNIMAEEIAAPLSKALPEDIIMEDNKEKTITDFVKASTQSKKAAADEQSSLIFINQDKSAFGPNKKFISFLIYAACLSPDRETFAFLRDTFTLGKTKKVRYPVEILKQSLGKVAASTGTSHDEADSNRDARTTQDNRSKTSVIMGKIAEQFHVGNANGPRGTDFTIVPEGMPGQGIMGISSSIQHAGALRLFAEVIKRNFGWTTKAVVTSDDSMTVLVFPQGDLNLVKESFRNLNNRLTALVGLIDNDSKFSCTMDKGEMNSLFFVRDMPCMPVEKFAMAFTHLGSSADFPQDILKASGTCGDLVRKGGTFFLSTVMAAINMVQVIDVHRFWSVYVNDMISGLNDIAQNPVQAYGLPDISPVLQVLSPLGSMFKPADSDFEENIAGHALWATRHFLQIPETISFEGDTNSYEQNDIGMLDDAKLGSVSYIRPISYWGLTGVRGMLRRPKGTLRLAREISPTLMSLRDKGMSRSLLGKLNLGGLISSVLDALSRPIDRGDSDKPAYLQHSDLAHSRDSPVLNLRPGSSLQLIFNKNKVSKNELSDFLSKSVTSRRLRDLHMLDVKKLSMADDKNNLGAIGESLKAELEFSMKVTASASKIRLRKSEDNIVIDESDSSSGPLPMYKYRVVKMGAQRLGSVTKDEITRHIFRSCCDVKEWLKLSLKERRNHYPEAPNGVMSLNESINLASNSAERLNAMLNPTNQIVARFPDGIFGRRDLIIAWIHGNTMLGASGSMISDFNVFSEVVLPIGAVGMGTLSRQWPTPVTQALRGQSDSICNNLSKSQTISGVSGFTADSSKHWSFSDVREPNLKGSLGKADLIPALMELAFIGREASLSRSVIVSVLESASQRGYMVGPEERSRFRVLNLSTSRSSKSSAFLIKSQPLKSGGPPLVAKYKNNFIFMQNTAQDKNIQVKRSLLHESDLAFLRSFGSPHVKERADTSVSEDKLRIPISKVIAQSIIGEDMFSATFLRPNVRVSAMISAGFLIVKLVEENLTIPVSFCIPLTELKLPEVGLRPTMVLTGSLLPTTSDTLEAMAEKLGRLSNLAHMKSDSSEIYGLAKTLAMRMPKKSEDPRSVLVSLEKSLLDYMSDGLTKFTFRGSGLKHLNFLNEDLHEEEYMEEDLEGTVSDWADAMEEEENDLETRIDKSLSSNKKLLGYETPFITVNYFVSPTDAREILKNPKDNWPKKFLFAAGLMDALDTLKKHMPMGFTTVDLPEHDWQVRLDDLNILPQDSERIGVVSRRFIFNNVASQMRFDELEAISASKSANLAMISLQVASLPPDLDFLASIGNYEIDKEMDALISFEE